MQQDQSSSEDNVQIEQDQDNQVEEGLRRQEIEKQRLEALKYRRTLYQNLSSKNNLADLTSQSNSNEVQLMIVQAQRMWTTKSITWIRKFRLNLEIKPKFQQFDLDFKQLLLMKIATKLLELKGQVNQFTNQNLRQLFTLYLGSKKASIKLVILKRILKRLVQYIKRYLLKSKNYQQVYYKQYSTNRDKFLHILIQGLLFQNIDKFTSMKLQSMFDLYVNQPTKYQNEHYELQIIVYLHNNFSCLPSIVSQMNFKTLSELDISLLNVIQRSDLITHYIHLYETIQPRQSLANNIKIFIKEAFQSLCNDPLAYTELQYDIFCSIDLTGNVRFSHTHTVHKFILLLMQIHSLLLSKLQYGLIIHTMKSQSNTLFSEMFPFPLDSVWLTVKRSRYLKQINNWLKPRSQFLSELYSIDQATQIVQQPSVIEVVHYNPLLSIIIVRIKELFVIVESELLNEDQKGIISKLKYNPDEIPTLQINYTKLQYYLILLKLIEQALTKTKLLLKIKKILQTHPKTLKENFDQFLSCTDELRLMVLETFYLCLFQKRRSKELAAKAIQCAINQKIHTQKIGSDDISLIRKIIWSQNTWLAIQEINSIYQKSNALQQCSEYEDLISFLSKFEVLEVEIPDVMGITLFNGRICLHRDYNPSISQPITRAQRIITLIHETFGHKKRIDYVDQMNVLKPTPAKLQKECGNFLETKLFGQTYSQFSLEQAMFILDEQNWDRPSQEFLNEFQKLPEHVIKVEESDRNKENSPLKRRYTNNVQQARPLRGCLFALLQSEI